MPLEKSLNVSPYFDDYSEDKQFYRVLFKPGVAVQARELNQVQTILQNQVERFGNHIFKSGTIISGVNFSYLPNYSYVKLKDSQVDGQPVSAASLNGLFVKSDLDLKAKIVNYEDGLESKAPDLKTIYVRYINSSIPDTSNGNVRYTTFSADQQLTVFSPDYPIFKTTVNNGGTGFANSDTVVFTSSIVITGNTGAFSNGETLTQATTGAKVVVAAINTTAVANTIILKVRPRSADLTNTSVNSTAWSLTAGYNVTGGSSGAYGNVDSLIGSGATGLLTTDSEGIIQSVTMQDAGSDYTFLPAVYVKTSNATATVNNLDLAPQNYRATITVANSSVNAIGSGYAFGVTEGVIYQKGLFLNVEKQVLIVDKYSTTPNNVAVGFKTLETFINSYADDSLNDNALGSPNYTAPGADRLKLTPVLYQIDSDTAAANVDFFALAEWKDGLPFKENKATAYNNLLDEMARRTHEASGNFVIDKFEFGTREKSTTNTSSFDLVIDPGLAYINGFRVQSRYNNYLDVSRATTTATQTNQIVTVNYGNYVIVNELAGVFDFKAGASVSLRSAAKQYITNATIGSGASITAPGTEIGTARMRSLVLERGNPGTAEAVYRLYLFNIQMNQGASFDSVRSIYYDGTYDAVCDIVLEYDATTASSKARLKDVSSNKMLFGAKYSAVESISNISYRYRTTSASSLQISSSGILQIGPLGTGLDFPYTGTLSSTQKQDFVVTPIANAEASANISGSSFVLTSGNKTVTGTGTTFGTDVVVGDFLKFSNATASQYHQVVAITNNTSLQLKTNASGSMTAANATLFFPALYPIDIASRSNRTVSVTSLPNTATINIATNLAATVNVVVTYNTFVANAQPVTKTINRDVYVKIHTSNNTGSNTGPWSLGIPGVCRLKAVYVGNSSSVSTSDTNITKYFYVDTGENENVYNNAKLVKRNDITYSLSSNTFLLVKIDAFTTGGTEGFFTVGSYNVDDTANLASSTSTINLLEIPEVVTTKGEYYDLRDTIDFRPYSVNTAVLATSPASANVNPAGTFSLSGDDQFFPVPDSEFTFDVSYYLPRQDLVVVDRDSNFEVITGTPSLTLKPPKLPARDEIALATLTIPPYPSIPLALNPQTQEFADRRTGADTNILSRRLMSFKVSPIELTTSVNTPVQSRRYTMEDVGKLERRINQLEYRIGLNAVEQKIRDMNIPSSVTPTTSRFKNGFFIDSFDTYDRSDVTHKEWAASIASDRSELIPLTTQINIESVFNTSDATTNNAVVDNNLLLPYSEILLINQPVKITPPVTPVVNVVAVVNTATSNVVPVVVVTTPDPVKIQFIGSGVIDPHSFKILSRQEQAPAASPVSYYESQLVNGTYKWVYVGGYHKVTAQWDQWNGWSGSAEAIAAAQATPIDRNTGFPKGAFFG